MRDLTEQAAPLDDQAIDVAGADQVADPTVLVERVFMDARDDLLGTRPVTRGDAVLQVAGNGLQTVTLLAGPRQPARPAIVVAAETETRFQICQIVNQLVERVILVLERGSDRQAVAL